MREPTPRLVDILKRYMRDPGAPVAECTSLCDLDIDLMDLPMIILDVEDAFDIHITYDEQIASYETLGDIVACIASRLEAKASPTLRSPRPKRSWISTTAA